jgi:hypothetical protein
MTRGTDQREKIYVRQACEICKGDEVLVYEAGDQLLCAEHTRKHLRANPTKQTCDTCGSDQNVFRDPSHRRNEYLCMSCHNVNGFKVQDSVTMRALRNIAGGS